MVTLWFSCRYKTLLQSLLKIWREERFTGLYSGMKPHLLKTIPGIVVTFLTYEAINSLLVTRKSRCELESRTRVDSRSASGWKQVDTNEDLEMWLYQSI